jgi:hypothetical protein
MWVGTRQGNPVLRVGAGAVYGTFRKSFFLIKKFDYKMDLDYKGKISWACMGEKDK